MRYSRFSHAFAFVLAALALVFTLEMAGNRGQTQPAPVLLTELTADAQLPAQHSGDSDEALPPATAQLQDRRARAAANAHTVESPHLTLIASGQIRAPPVIS